VGQAQDDLHMAWRLVGSSRWSARRETPHSVAR
jgi:hypothetical protein